MINQAVSLPEVERRKGFCVKGMLGEILITSDIMKTSVLKCGLIALVGACLLNAVVNTGCTTKPADQRNAFKFEGVDQAAGKTYDTPVVY